MPKNIYIAYIAAVAALGLIGIVPAHADVFSSYECNATGTVCTGAAVNGGNFDLISNTNPNTGAGGLEFEVSPTNTLTLADLTQLSAEYDMVSGAFEAGAPRFTLFDDSLNAAYIYFGTPTGGGSFTNPNPNGTFANTGNYASLSSSDIRVYSNGFGGDNRPNTGVTFQQFVSGYGSTDISYITLDLDSGSFDPAQEMLVSSFTVNNETDVAPQTAVPEPFTLSLFGAGLAGAAALRRRKGAQKA